MRREAYLSLLLVGLLLLSMSACSAQVIEDTTKDIPPGYYYVVGFQTKASGVTVHYKISVESGPNVNVYLLDRTNYDKYKTTGTYDKAIKEHKSIKEIDSEVKLEEAADYYLIVENPSLTDTAKVHIYIEGKRGYGAIAIIAIIVIIVIIIVVVLIKKKKKATATS